MLNVCVCVCYLEESLLLLQMFTDHWSDVVCLTVGPQLVGSSAPVLLSLVLLLQALQHTAHLSAQTHSVSSLRSTLHLHYIIFVELSVASHLFGCFVKGHRGVDQLQPVLHLQHELLPVGGHALGTVSDQVHVVVVGLEQSLGLLLDLQSTLVGFLQRRKRWRVWNYQNEQNKSFRQ